VSVDISGCSSGFFLCSTLPPRGTVPPRDRRRCLGARGWWRLHGASPSVEATRRRRRTASQRGGRPAAQPYRKHEATSLHQEATDMSSIWLRSAASRLIQVTKRQIADCAITVFVVTSHGKGSTDLNSSFKSVYIILYRLGISFFTVSCWSCDSAIHKKHGRHRNRPRSIVARRITSIATSVSNLIADPTT
jgi:hypothetical protein